MHKMRLNHENDDAVTSFFVLLVTLPNTFVANKRVYYTQIIYIYI